MSVCRHELVGGGVQSPPPTIPTLPSALYSTLRRRRISSTNCVEFLLRRSRRFISHSRRRRIFTALSPSHLGLSFSTQPLNTRQIGLYFGTSSNISVFSVSLPAHSSLRCHLLLAELHIALQQFTPTDAMKHSAQCDRII